MKHLLNEADKIRLWLIGAILTPLYIWVRDTWSAFVITDPVVAICALWLADLILGLSYAIIDGRRHAKARRLDPSIPLDPTRGLKVERIMRSFYKLLGYLFGMGLAAVLIWVGHGNIGLSGAGACLQTIILFKEFVSAVRNTGILFGLEFMSVFADEVEAKTIKMKRGGVKA